MLRIWQPSDERLYFHRVDALRGLGCCTVAAFHIGGWTMGQLPLLPGNSVYLIPGHAALMMFFVISGFVLRLALDHAAGSPGFATRFLLARLFRIYPIAWVALLLAAAIPACRVGIAVTQLPDYGLSDWLAAALLLDVAFNDTLWALQVELLAAPIILMLHLLERRWGHGMLAGLAVMLTALAFLPGWAISRPLSNTCFAFALGMLVPNLGQRGVQMLKPTAASASACAALGVLLASGPVLGTYSVFSKIVEGYAAAWLMSMAVYRPELRLFRWLDAKPLVWLGQAAGSYYVLHMATIPLYLPLAAMLFPPHAWAGPAALALWLALLVPLARAGFALVERPGIQLGRRVAHLFTRTQRNKQSATNDPLRQAA